MLLKYTMTINYRTLLFSGLFECKKVSVFAEYLLT